MVCVWDAFGQFACSRDGAAAGGGCEPAGGAFSAATAGFASAERTADGQVVYRPRELPSSSGDRGARQGFYSVEGFYSAPPPASGLPGIGQAAQAARAAQQQQQQQQQAGGAALQPAGSNAAAAREGFCDCGVVVG